MPKDLDREKWLEYFRLALTGSATTDLGAMAGQMQTIATPGGESVITVAQIGRSIARLAGAIATGAVLEDEEQLADYEAKHVLGPQLGTKP